MAERRLFGEISEAAAGVGFDGFRPNVPLDL